MALKNEVHALQAKILLRRMALDNEVDILKGKSLLRRMALDNEVRSSGQDSIAPRGARE